MSETALNGNTIESLHIGNTRVRICDDYCRSRTPEEIKAILDRIALRAIGSLTAETTRGYAET